MSLKTLKTRRARVLAAIAAVAVVLGGGTAAFAAIALAPNVNTIGAGGYAATTTSTAGMTSNQAVINADQYGLTVAGGRHGIKMCNSTTNETAAIGEFSNNLNTDYSVQWGVGTGSGCPAGELPVSSLVTFPALAAVPFGHHVWVSERKVTRTRTIVILVCILNNHNGNPVPTPTPTPTTTTTLPAPTPTTTSASPSVAPVTTSPSTSPTETKTPEPTSSDTESASTAALVRHHSSDPTPQPSVTEPGVPELNGLPGDFFKCRIIVKTVTKNVMVFEAQDLDAPTVTPAAGDLAGVQLAVVRIPAGTVFDNAVAGLSENTATLTHCVGGGFPISLGGPANYASAACQPVDVQEYAGFTDGTGPFTDYQSGTTTEMISPSAGGALVAPNNSIGTLNLGPHGPTSAGASLTGSHFVMSTGNAPVS